MKRKFKNLVFLLFIIALGVGSAGCTTQEPEVVEKTVVVVETQEVVKTVEKIVEVEKPVEVEASKAGGDLIVRIADDMENFDTHTNQLQVFRSVIQWAIFEPLVRYNENLELEGILAESWQPIDDNTWQFALRNGVKFHNGEEVTAEDVKYSLDRVADPDTGSWLIGNLAEVDEIEVIDDYTINIITSSPVASLLDKLVVIGIIPIGSGDGQKRAPIGSGPFKFVEYSANEFIKLEKNADYWQEDAPYVDTITFRPVTEVSVALNQLQAGDLDVITMISAAEASAAVQVPNAQLTVQPATTVLSFFEINRRVEPLNDPAVFAALTKCMDREAVGSLVYQGYGTATASPITPSSPYRADIQYEYDPETAKAELEALGYKPGDIKLEIISWGGFKSLENMALVWKDGLEKAGVEVEINVLEVQAMLDRYNKHDFDIATNLYAPPPDPDVYYDIIWGPRLADDYIRPLADQLIAEGRSTFDIEARQEIYAELQELGHSDGPCLPVWLEAALAAQNELVRGLLITPMGDYDFSGVYLEK